MPENKSYIITVWDTGLYYEAECPTRPTRNQIAWSFAHGYDFNGSSNPVPCRYTIESATEKMAEGKFVLRPSQNLRGGVPYNTDGTRIRKPRRAIKLDWCG